MTNGILDSSQKIVTNGLVLNYDIAQLRSYPTTGTNITDLSGNNNNGTLVNGVAFNSNNGGSLAFDGINDYVTTSFTSTAMYNISIWFYTPSQILSGKNPVGYGGLGYYGTSGTKTRYDGFSFGDYTGVGANETISYYQENPQQIIYITNVIPIGYTNIVMNYNDVDLTYDFYLNGIKVTRYIGTTGAIPLFYTNIITLGSTGDPTTVGAGYYGSIRTSIVQVYNRSLSAAEVLQNFNANRSRYGL